MPRSHVACLVRPLIVVAFTWALAAPVAHAQDDGALTVERIEWWGWPDGMRSIFTAAIAGSTQIVISGGGDNGIAGGYRRAFDGWDLFYATEHRVVEVDDDGVAVGWVSGRPLDPDSDVHAFVAEPGGFRRTSELDEPATAVDVRAVGIDGNGVVHGRATLETNGTRTIHPFRWDGTFDVLDLTIGEARACNDLGQVVLREYTASGYVLRVLQPDGTVEQLPIPPYAWTSPNDVNAAGHVVGDAEDMDFTRDEAFLWDGTDYTILPLPTGFTQADAEAIDDQGRIVGWGWNGDFAAVVWDDTTPADLTALAREALGEDVELEKAFDVSNSGWVVGYGYRAGGGAPEIFTAKLGRGCRGPATIDDAVRWTAPSSGLFDDAENWAGGGVPGRDAVVRFDTGTAATVTVIDDLIHRSLLLDAGAVDPVFDLGGATWILEGDDPCLRSLYTLPVQGASTFAFSGGIVRAERGVDFAHRGRSSFTLRDGAELLVDGGPVTAGHADSTVIVIEDGSALRFGPEGMVLGADAGEHAGLVIAGDGNELTGMELVAGGAGSAEVTMVAFADQDNTVQIDALRAARAVGSSAELIFTSPGFLEANTVEVGIGGEATMEVATGFFLGATALELGTNPQARGHLEISADSFVAAGDVLIARHGSARIEVRNGGVLNATTLVGEASTARLSMGEENGADAQVDVTGEGSKLLVRSASVGVRGTGLIQVGDGGLAEIAETTVIGELLDQGLGGVFVYDGGRFVSDMILVGPGSLLQSATVSTDQDGTIETRRLVVLDGATVEGNVFEFSGPANRSGSRSIDPASVTVAELELRDGATLDVSAVRFGTGWSLSGDGTFPHDVLNTGRVEPDGGDLPGVLTIDGDYEQSADGVLRIGLRASDDLPVGPLARRAVLEADRLSVTGTAQLGGTLELVLADGLVVESGDTFRLLDATAVAGSFDAVIAPDGMQVDLIPTADGVEVSVLTPPVRATTIELRLRDDASTLTWNVPTDLDEGRFVVEGAPASGDWTELDVVAFERGVQSYHWPLDAAPAAFVRFRVTWIDRDGTARRNSPTITRDAPAAFVVAASPVRPNPFNPRAAFTLHARRDTDVRVRVLDARGRAVDVLHHGPIAAGTRRTMEIDGTDWSSGVYFVHVDGPGVRHTQKIVLVE